jgi:hypothetical protein
MYYRAAKKKEKRWSAKKSGGRKVKPVYFRPQEFRCEQNP